MIQVIEYIKEHQMGINEMMVDISLEFEGEIFAKATSQTPLIPDVYWVALFNDIVIGTVGLSLRSNYAILKRMMLKKEFRGKGISVSDKLLQTAMRYCLTAQFSDVYLGTMSQFKAAQRFYIKNGFYQILEQELPSDFMLNPLDSVFFKKSLWQ